MLQFEALISFCAKCPVECLSQPDYKARSSSSCRHHRRPDQCDWTEIGCSELAADNWLDCASDLGGHGFLVGVETAGYSVGFGCADLHPGEGCPGSGLAPMQRDSSVLHLAFQFLTPIPLKRKE